MADTTETVTDVEIGAGGKTDDGILAFGCFVTTPRRQNDQEGVVMGIDFQQ